MTLNVLQQRWLARAGGVLLVFCLPLACRSESQDAARVAPADASVDAAVSPLPDGATPPDASLSDLERLDQLLAALRSAAPEARAGLVADFVHTVAYGEKGFPIRAQGKLAFVYWDADRTGAPFSVAGDFNGWSTTAMPLERPLADLPLYVRVVDDPLPKGRSLYKIVRGGTTFFADPVARRYGYDDNGEHSLLEAGIDRGHLERWPSFGEARGSLDARTLTAWLPPGYDPAAKPGYPLLVMHDGQNLFDPAGPHGSWRVGTTAEDLVLRGAIRPVVIVGVPATSHRFDEYTHVVDTIPGYGTLGGAAAVYAKFIAEGVVPFARARYRVRSEPEQTAVMGASLGGLVSLYIGLRRADVFGNAASVSGTISWGSIGASNATIEQLFVQSPPRTVSLYLDSGGDDGGGCGALRPIDSEQYHDQYCETAHMRDTLVSLGWTLDKDLFYAWTPMAPHDESAWAARLPGIFTRWFPRR